MIRSAVLLAATGGVLCALLPAAAPAAGPMYWDSPARIAFTDGELQGAAIDPGGSLVPGLEAAAALADSGDVFWCADLADDGALLVGGGHAGRVWRIGPDGQAERLADLPTAGVFSLLADDGRALAGCGPDGQVFAIDRRGEVRLLGEVPGGFVWGLARGADRSVYLATGSPAAVYRLTGDDALQKVVDLPADNALDLAVRDDGTLLAVTQGPGRVFSIDPRRGEAALLLAMEQDEGRRLVRGPDGWYALGFQAERPSDGQDGRDDRGQALPLDPFTIMVTADAQVQPVRVALYRLDGEVPERVWSSELGLTSVAWSDDHGWLGAGSREQGPTRLLALDEPNGARPLAAWDGGEVIELIVQDRGAGPDEVLAIQAHPALVTRLEPADRDGEGARALSAPLDGRLPVRWGRLTWRGESGGQQPRFAVRTGQSPRPDATWSGWRELGRGRELDLGGLPAARSLQWRVDLPAGSRVDAVTVSALAPNLAPRITLFDLQPAGELRLGGMMASGENVVQRLPGGLQIEYSAQRRDDRRLDRERAAALRPLRTLTWHAQDPNEDDLVYDLCLRREGGEFWLPVARGLTDQVFTWDTAGLEDGFYQLRLTVRDDPDNPAPRALAASRVLERLPVDNTPPELDGWALDHQPGGFALKLQAREAGEAVAGAELVLPDGSLERLDPVDGICDGRREDFEATIAYPPPWATAPPRPWTVKVRIWDLHGNVATVSGVLP